MSDLEPSRLGARLRDTAVGVLVASIALWFAVEIIRSIWPWIAGAVTIAVIVWLVRWWRQFR